MPTTTRPKTRTSQVLTLAVDIGGSHLKAAVLGMGGEELAGPRHVETPQPSSPEAVVAALVELAKPLGRFDRVSVGFPGVVRAGCVLTAPNLGNDAWRRFPLAAELAHRLGKPARMLNDASIQGLGVISGRGQECVLTMGTGMGFAVFEDGRLGPHLEVSQIPVKTGKTYDQYVGNAALHDIGANRWNRRVRKVIAIMRVLVNYDVLYIGGGNARLITPKLPDNVKLVPNEAGVTGGIRLWDKRMDVMFAEHPSFE
jgi:polyphosphate glucokinase